MAVVPSGTFDASIALQSVILASTNDAVDRWNGIIQSLNNTEVVQQYYSRDSFDEVDDENGVLKRIQRGNSESFHTERAGFTLRSCPRQC